MPNKPKNLVVRLQDLGDSYVHERPVGMSKHDAELRRSSYVHAAELATPYEEQRLALEKVKDAAFDFLAGRSSRLSLVEALAAVPPLPEESDGS